MSFLPPLKKIFWWNKYRTVNASEVMENDRRNSKIKFLTGKDPRLLADKDFAVLDFGSAYS